MEEFAGFKDAFLDSVERAYGEKVRERMEQDDPHGLAGLELWAALPPDRYQAAALLERQGVRVPTSEATTMRKILRVRRFVRNLEAVR